MSLSSRKNLWLFVLASCTGVICLVLSGVTAILGEKGSGTALMIAFILLSGECSLAYYAASRLKACLREAPEKWTGRWQFSLADLLWSSIFTALVLSIFKALQPEHNFVYVGIAMSLVLGLGYAGMLLLVNRIYGEHGAAERWLFALTYLIFALVFTSVATMTHCFLLGCVLSPLIFK